MLSCHMFMASKSPIYIHYMFINCTKLQYSQECGHILYIIHHVFTYRAGHQTKVLYIYLTILALCHAVHMVYN